MKLRGVMIILIIACQAAIYGGGLCSKLTLQESVEKFCDDHNLADLQVTFDVKPSDRLPDLAGIEGVREVKSRLLIKGGIHLGDGTTIPAVVIFVRAGENPAIDTLQIEDGAFPSDNNLGVVIERGLRTRGYGVGDEITVSAYGFTQTQKIVGIARSPEFLVSTANPEMLIPTPGSLGIIYSPVECCEKEMKKLAFHLGGKDPVNQLLFLYDKPGSIWETETGGGPGSGTEKEILARLSGAKKKLGITSVLQRADQFGIRFLQQDLKMFRIIVLAIVGVFSVVTLIVTGISVNRIVMSQRREIGALMAFGYRPGAIMRSYIRMGFLMGLSGGLIGAVSSPAVNYLLASTYASAINLPPVRLAFNARILVEGALIGIAVASVAAVVPLIKLVRLTPVQAMRGGVDDSLQRMTVVARAAGALTGILSGSLAQRAAVRNLFRRLKLTAATTLLIALGLGITAGFVITLTSVIDSSAALLRHDRWDIIADFREPESSKQAAKLSGKAGLVDPELFARGYASISFGGHKGDYQLVGVQIGGRLRELDLTKGGGFTGDEANEIIFNASFSDVAPPALGEKVIVTSGGKEHSLTVAGFISSLSVGQVYVPIGTARRILGLKGKCSGFMAKLNGKDAEAVEKKLYASDRVGRVTVRSELEKAINDQLAKATQLITLAVIMGAAVALAIVVNTMSMNILERENEFATLMSLGYSRPPLAGMVLTEVFVMGVAALALAVPIAFGIAGYMNAELSQVWFKIDTYFKLKDFAMALFVPFLLLPLAAVPALRHVFRLNIALVVRRHVIE